MDIDSGLRIDPTPAARVAARRPSNASVAQCLCGTTSFPGAFVIFVVLVAFVFP
jgi:hypothetical protein